LDIYNLKDFKGGWFIGNFEPSVLKTGEFEVGIAFHPSGSFWAPHYHSFSTEYNLLLEGKMSIIGNNIEAGQIFVIKPNEVADPVFLTDCRVLIVKTPSVPGDKVLV
jgi:hypothetical protein